MKSRSLNYSTREWKFLPSVLPTLRRVLMTIPKSPFTLGIALSRILATWER